MAIIGKSPSSQLYVTNWAGRSNENWHRMQQEIAKERQRVGQEEP